jgi:hypothetical protein
MAIIEIESGAGLGKRAGIGAFWVPVAVVLLWVSLYFTGFFPWLGYAWLKQESFGAGPVTVVGEDQAGTSFGPSTFLFLKGQEIVIDYDATIRTGSLWLYVFDLTKAGQGGGGSHYVTQSGSGVWTYRVPRTGLYKITIDASVVRGAGRGYDMNYRVWWGARWAG